MKYMSYLWKKKKNRINPLEAGAHKKGREDQQSQSWYFKKINNIDELLTEWSRNRKTQNISEM